MANRTAVTLVALLVLMPGALFAAGQSEVEETVVIKLSDQVNEQNPHFLAHQFFAERVAELSDGSVEVQVFPNSQLGDARESLEGTLTGIMEAAKVSAGQLNAYSPAFSIFSQIGRASCRERV
jgi:TRAP-type C4-dicarboxylate transport system substrate-binding protein